MHSVSGTPKQQVNLIPSPVRGFSCIILVLQQESGLFVKQEPRRSPIKRRLSKVCSVETRLFVTAWSSLLLSCLVMQIYSTAATTDSSEMSAKRTRKEAATQQSWTDRSENAVWPRPQDVSAADIQQALATHSLQNRPRGPKTAGKTDGKDEARETKTKDALQHGVLRTKSAHALIAGLCSSGADKWWLVLGMRAEELKAWLETEKGYKTINIKTLRAYATLLLPVVHSEFAVCLSLCLSVCLLAQPHSVSGLSS